MHSGIKLLGHHVHPMLIVIPLGVLPVAVLFDLLYLGTGAARWTTISFYLIPVGVLGALVAAVVGLLDWLAIPKRTRAKRIGAIHGIGNVIVVGLFAWSWIVRVETPATPGSDAIVLSVLGVLLAVITGWLGGELVERLEDRLERFGRNAGSGVLDAELDAALGARDADRDRAPLGELDRVPDQVPEDELQHLAVGLDGLESGRDVPGDRELGLELFELFDPTQGAVDLVFGVLPN